MEIKCKSCSSQFSVNENNQMPCQRIFLLKSHAADVLFSPFIFEVYRQPCA